METQEDYASAITGVVERHLEAHYTPRLIAFILDGLEPKIRNKLIQQAINPPARSGCDENQAMGARRVMKNIGERHMKVLAALRCFENGGATCHQVAMRMSTPRQPIADNWVSGRLSELRNLGHTIKTAERRTVRVGDSSTQAVWIHAGWLSTRRVLPCRCWDSARRTNGLSTALQHNPSCEEFVRSGHSPRCKKCKHGLDCHEK